MFNIPLAHSHNPGLVIVSIIIAILASYTALDLAGRVTAALGRSRFNWLVGGAVAMGMGIWSMHFTAMLAFELSIPVFYDVPIVMLSLLVAIVASGLALFIASRQVMNLRQLVGGGVVMGVAIAAMHYIGMAAMRLNATLTYEPFFFTLSIVIAISASLAALWLAFQFRGDLAGVWNWLKIGSAVVMGGAISGMHYTGMHAAIFMPTTQMVGNVSNAINISLLGTGAIVISTFMVLGLALLLSIVDQRLVTQATYLAQTEQRHSETLQQLNSELEDRLAALQLLTEVSRTMMAILDIKQLVHEVVTQIRSTFDYYHVHIYLVDDRQENLVVVAGTGPAGKEMLAKGHYIPVKAPTSLVARAARTGQVVKVDNVRQAKDWLPNPLLPDTYSEMAVPIILDEKVVGVLDLQEDEISGFDEDDVSLLRSLANQVAVALRNARLFDEVEIALAEARAAQELYVEQSWDKANVRREGERYHYAHSAAPPPGEDILVQAKQLALRHNYPVIMRLDHGDASPKIDDQTRSGEAKNLTISTPQAIVAPITLQNRVIGTLQVYPASPNHTWSDGDLAIVTAIVEQLAQTADNLRLFDESRERGSREQTIREITDKLRAAPNLDILLETAARELGQRLGVRHTVLELGLETDRSKSMPNSKLIDNGH